MKNSCKRTDKFSIQNYFLSWSAVGVWLSTEVTFALLTQLPQVRIPALPFLLTAQFLNNNEIEPIQCQPRDFAKQSTATSQARYYNKSRSAIGRPNQGRQEPTAFSDSILDDSNRIVALIKTHFNKLETLVIARGQLLL